MSTTQERVDGAVDDGVDPLRAILERQRQAFLADGPPSVAVRRNRIDRLLALVLDNADDFVGAIESDFGTRPRTGSLFTEVLGMISVIEHTRSRVPQWMRATS
jgi:coniferyl-aldehyde dehydrogenase